MTSYARRIVWFLPASLMIAIAGACSDDTARGASGLECAESSDAPLDSYYMPCAGPDDACPEPYVCVNSNVDPEAEPYYACLIPCCDSSECPAPHGCIGDPGFPVFDVGPDGYCAEAP